MPSLCEMEWVYGLKLPQHWKRKSGFSIFIESTAEQTTTKVNVPIVKAINQLKDIYADADQTELMKMAVRMPDAMKIERDEIDENDWAQIKVVIEEGLNNIMTFRKDERVSLEKISIAYWKYSTVHDDTLALDVLKAIKSLTNY
jgi:uncharacterized protein YicC (UPF0701 family)